MKFLKSLAAAALLAAVTITASAQSTPGNSQGFWGQMIPSSNAIVVPCATNASSHTVVNVNTNRVLIPHGGVIALSGTIHSTNSAANISNVTFSLSFSLDGTNWSSVATNGAGPGSFTIAVPAPGTNGAWTSNGLATTPGARGYTWATNVANVGNYRWFTLSNIVAYATNQIVISNFNYRVISNLAGGVYH